ncbi:MAG: hypothetical protein ACFFG0_02740, partial [Candidatus Thorarchaeota archaeon]
MTINYKNKYGSLVLEQIEPERAISEWTFTKELLPIGFDVETAEKIALITENKKIQLALSMDFKIFYCFYHTNVNSGFVCKIKSIFFSRDINPIGKSSFVNVHSLIA